MPAWILDQWPGVWGGFVYVSFLVWGPAPDWLQPFELIGSSYLDVSSGSVHIVTVSMAVSLFISPTTPTHIPFACVCHRLTFKTQPCNSLTVILFYCHWAQRQVHHQISGVAFMCACVCQCVNDTPRFWQLYGAACDEQQQGETLWCFFSSLSLVAPPLLLSWLWSLHSGAEISVFHRVGHRQCARYCVFWRKRCWVEVYGDVMCIGEGAQVRSLLSTTQRLLQHTRTLLFLISLFVCMFVRICVSVFVSVQVSWDASECHECLRQLSCLCVFLIMIVRACVCFYVHVCSSLSAWLCIFCGALISEWSWRVLFDSNLSWNPLLLSQVTLSLFLFSCFFSFRSYCHKTKQTARQCLYRSDTFPKSRPEFSKSHSGAWL